ncbi:MAG: hypothetical protein AAGF79_07980 [Pseudomonadota bacterium]
MFMTARQRSDYVSAQALLDNLPPAKHMLTDRGYDANCYREALAGKGIAPCNSSRKSQKVPIPHDEVCYKKRHKIVNSLLATRAGQGFQPAMTDARKFSRPRWLPWSYSGYEFYL